MPDNPATFPAYRINHLAWELLDFIYPPHCAGCGKAGTRWCSDCKNSLHNLPHSSACPVCDLPLQPGQACPDCSRNRPNFELLRSVFIYEGPLRKAIHRLKFKNDIGLAETFGTYLVQAYRQLDWEVDLLTAVPLSKKRQRERGYNQSQLIARNLSWAVGIPYQKDLLFRNRDTRSQVGLDAVERDLNVEGAFSPGNYPIRGKSILVVDDIATTGATVSHCARALLDAGASHVYGMTLARAVRLEPS